MKNLFGMASLTTWVSDILANFGFPLGKKTPWYRPSRLRSVPWLAVAFIAPFAIFLVWKGAGILLGQGESAAPSENNQPPATELM